MKAFGWALAGVILARAASATPPPLQPLVDATPAGGTLTPAAGTYSGPVSIRRPIRIEGKGRVTVDGGKRGSVIVIRTSDAVVRGLRLVNSGESHDGLDAGVQVRGDRNIVEDNVIEDCLFGVDLQQSNANVVRRNRISSKVFEMGVRGDAVRLWYSRDNRIEENRIADVRDVVVWYSRNNHIARNVVTGSRYALHFMYSERNRVEGNRYEGNMVGVFLMYSDGVQVVNNTISRALGATGMGIGFKETSDVTVEGNTILHCAKAIYVDTSPYQPDTTNRFVGNRIAYNGVGMMFHSDWAGNMIRGNRFVGNFTQVAVRGGGSAERNAWEENYWDDYQGFDRDGDGRGDTPYEFYAFSDRLWMEIPMLQFFRASPVLELLDFLERLAPFSEPTRILRDPSPLLRDALDEVG